MVVNSKMKNLQKASKMKNLQKATGTESVRNIMIYRSKINKKASCSTCSLMCLYEKIHKNFPISRLKKRRKLLPERGSFFRGMHVKYDFFSFLRNIYSFCMFLNVQMQFGITFCLVRGVRAIWPGQKYGHLCYVAIQNNT